MFNGLMRQILGALLLCIYLQGLQASPSRQVLSGTLGKMPIVLEINTDDPKDVTGRYFYQKYHHDLALNGTLVGQALELREGGGRPDDEQAALPTFKLQQTGDGWQGQWQDSKGKTLDVQLSTAKAEAPKPDALPYLAQLYPNDLYEYLRLQGLALKQGKQQSFMGYTLQWWSEPGSKLSMFKVVGGYPEAQQQRLNQLLMERLWREVSAYHECLLGAGSQGGEFMQTVKPQFFSPAVLSVNISTSYSCGGAHPDFGDSPMSIDVNSGHPLSLSDVLWVGQGQPLLHSDRNGKGDTRLTEAERTGLYEYNQEKLAPWLVQQFRALYPDKMREPTDPDEGCNYSDESVWGDNSWYFTPKGLFLKAYFPRVARACDGPEWAVLPYALVRKHPGAVALELPKH
ncbi:hypothetical protein SAMN03159355_01432 [Pseudomonas sp. NFPP10]|uniref:hypothetical protein n=1 Tax=unclassified Pseudomonas TaxID=196821 RepID=UPI000891E075|nr:MULTISPECIES: hypothetical protein [unclassified Pseudomonas]SDA17916.1 hypothetical protein SAMN03159465_01900 [Pseudomonas sp. NFPP12]SEK95590.1 hypothetical protein SAMN03159355_01432 [Pseudomonas sp. NFPP10]SFI54323.1 hypothetical protein SAMN03159416_01850 [Pseudomonas sp. NFPP08]SFM41052.1 hypothetical protein SAMN03159476_01482 [Pseudomonas sp. NFPP05]SFX29716.1 hypothetical protein SAMN03159479_01432 [Pseudomonas sp. NFPP09]